MKHSLQNCYLILSLLLFFTYSGLAQPRFTYDQAGNRVARVYNPVPDLTPIIRLPLGNFTASGTNTVRQFTADVTEYLGVPTSSGTVVLVVTAPLGYTLYFDNTLTSTTVSGDTSPVTVSNNKWSITGGAQNTTRLFLTMNAGQNIPANGTLKVGLTITRGPNVTSGSSSNLQVSINDDPTLTYDSNPRNNGYARVISAL